MTKASHPRNIAQDEPSFAFCPQRRKLGQAQRKIMRRQEHARWAESFRKRGASGDPLALLARSMQGRIPALSKLKYERMAASPFGFFRGAVPVMAADLACLPTTSIHTQICGDAHVHNLGAYAGVDGRLVFDINDFDETIRGPFEWDLKRMASSLVVAGRESGARESSCVDAALAFAQQYRAFMRSFSRLPVLEVARFQVHRLHNVQPVSDALLQAQRAVPQLSVRQLTVRDKTTGHRVFIDQRPLLHRITGALASEILASLNAYRVSLLPERRHFLAQYRPIDVGFKVVGTGSVGLRDYIVYLQGNGPGDPLFLQIKEEAHSAYAEYLSPRPPRKAAPSNQAKRRPRVAEDSMPDAQHQHQHQGQRAAEGQRAMQLQSDPFLGWTRLDGRDYLVRQLNDHKGSVAVSGLKGVGLIEYAEVCGELLARGHARSGDACLLSGYLGNSERFDQALASFAVAYADQTERDWKLLKRSGI